MMVATCSCQECTELVRYGVWYDDHIQQRAWLPVAPLVRRVMQLGGPGACGVTPGLRRAYDRARERGRVEDYLADRLAIRMLSVHPSTVWPEWFSTDVSHGCSPYYPQGACATVDV